MSSELQAVIAPHKDNIISRLEATLQINALDNRGVLTSPRRAPATAKQIGSLFFKTLSGAIDEEPMEHLVADLLQKGLAYSTAAKAMQTLRQAVLETGQDNPSVVLPAISIVDKFSHLFLMYVAAGREAAIAREQEHYQASLQETLRIQLENQHLLAAKLDAHQQKLQAIISISSAIASIADEMDLANRFIELVPPYLEVAGAAIFELSATLDTVIVKAVAGRIPKSLRLNQPQPVHPGSALEQVISWDDLVLTPLDIETEGVAWQIMSPIKTGMRLSGILVLWDTQTELSKEDVGFMRPLTLLLSGAWQNVRLLSQAEERARELEVMHGAKVQAAWSKGVQTVAYQAYTYNGVSIIPEEPKQDALAEEFISFPVQMRDLSIGRLLLPLSGDAPLKQEDQEFVEAVLREMSGALENANLIFDTQRRANQEQILREITAAISASKNVVAALPLLAQQLRRIAPVDLLILTTYTPGDPDLEVWAADVRRKGENLAQKGRRLPLDGSASGWVIKHNDVWLDKDIRKTRKFSEDEKAISSGITSRLVFPLRLGETVIGTFNLASLQSNAFNEDHLPLLEQIANQMATAMERSLLLEEAQRRANREQAIREITEKMRAASSLEQLVKTTAAELGNRLAAGHAIVELGLEKDTTGV